MQQYNTNETCPTCLRGLIVAEFFRGHVASFHCSDNHCLDSFPHPPGRPDAEQEILAKVRSESND